MPILLTLLQHTKSSLYKQKLATRAWKLYEYDATHTISWWLSGFFWNCGYF